VSRTPSWFVGAANGVEPPQRRALGLTLSAECFYCVGVAEAGEAGGRSAAVIAAGKLLRARAAHAAGQFLAMRRLAGVGAALELVLRLALRQPVVPVRLRGLPHPLLMRREGSDRYVLREIFVERELEVTTGRPVRTVLDGGAYVGYSTAFLALRYPDARVVAVEPDPENFALLQQNTRGFENVRVVRAALWDEARPLGLENPGDPSWGRRVTDRASGHGEVDGLTIPVLLAQHGFARVDLLKLDVEGAEERLLGEEADDWLVEVDTAIIEAHGPAGEAAVHRVATELGFERSRSLEKHILRSAKPS
jgi:FkbM family methyltransferase